MKKYSHFSLSSINILSPLILESLIGIKVLLLNPFYLPDIEKIESGRGRGLALNKAESFPFLGQHKWPFWPAAWHGV
jgi:hypothetical protein